MCLDIKVIVCFIVKLFTFLYCVAYDLNFYLMVKYTMQDVSLKENDKLGTIQLLRGLAALMVVFGHYCGYLNGVYSDPNLGPKLFPNAAFSVDVFFIISGFIMVYSTNRILKRPVLDFFIKRAFRIYPVYYLVLSLTILLYYIDYNSWSFFGDIASIHTIIKSFLLIPLDISAQAPFYGYSLVQTAWTLSYEIYFYIVFGLSMMMSVKYRSIICITIIITLCILIQFTLTNNVTTYPYDATFNRQSILSNILFISNPIVLDFIVGVIIGEIYLKTKDNFWNKTGVYYIALGMVVFSANAWLSTFGSGHGLFWKNGILSGGVSAFLFCGLLYIDKYHKLKLPTWVYYFGAISYSLYIVHIPLQIIFEKLQLHLMAIPLDNGFVKFISMIVFAIYVSAILHRFVEKPFIKISRKLCAKIERSSNTN